MSASVLQSILIFKIKSSKSVSQKVLHIYILNNWSNCRVERAKEKHPDPILGTGIEVPQTLSIDYHQFLSATVIPNHPGKLHCPQGTLYKLCILFSLLSLHPRGSHPPGFFLPKESNEVWAVTFFCRSVVKPSRPRGVGQSFGKAPAGAELLLGGTSPW